MFRMAQTSSSVLSGSILFLLDSWPESSPCSESFFFLIQDLHLLQSVASWETWKCLPQWPGVHPLEMQSLRKMEFTSVGKKETQPPPLSQSQLSHHLSSSPSPHFPSPDSSPWAQPGASVSLPSIFVALG